MMFIRINMSHGWSVSPISAGGLHNPSAWSFSWLRELFMTYGIRRSSRQIVVRYLAS